MAKETERTDPVTDAIAAPSLHRLIELATSTTRRRDQHHDLGALNTPTQGRRTN